MSANRFVRRTAATADKHLVIIGASLAGAEAAEGAGTAGFDGRVILIGDEHEPPSERPVISKAVLRGEAAPETTRVHDATFHDAHAIELRTGRTVPIGRTLEPSRLADPAVALGELV